MAVIPGQGTTLSVDISSVQTAIVDCTDIKGPSKERPKIKTTSLSSMCQTYRPGLLDVGEVTFSIWYDPRLPTHAALEALAEAVADADSVKPWTLTFNDATDSLDATTEEFDGFVMKFEKTGMQTDENLSADVTIQVTGATEITVDATP